MLRVLFWRGGLISRSLAALRDDKHRFEMWSDLSAVFVSVVLCHGRGREVTSPHPSKGCSPGEDPHGRSQCCEHRPDCPLCGEHSVDTSAAEVAVQRAIQKPFRRAGSAGAALLSFLHGHWLHEPLHVVLTDVPVGAWSVTVVADTLDAMTGRESLHKVADVALAIGLVGAVGAAVTGMVDWSEIRDRRPRRIGSVHALLNIGATALFAASCVTRKTAKRRTVSRALAAAGYVMVSVSAHLGGNMIYEHGIGVLDSARSLPPATVEG